jgi:phosphohistidine phosphatase
MSHTLYLLRHAIAEVHAPSGRDEDRRLTAEGAAKMRRAALGLSRLDVLPAGIWSSPLVRARETAQIVSSALEPNPPLTIYDLLAPGHPSAQVLAGLRPPRGSRSLMLVGHEPDLGQLASQLLTGSPSAAAFEFKKGAVMAFEVGALPPKAPATLLWFMTPKPLRRLGRNA